MIKRTTQDPLHNTLRKQFNFFPEMLETGIQEPLGALEASSETNLAQDPPSERVKDLLKRRATAKMVFTKKVNLFQDRIAKGDPYDSLKFSYSQIEERFDVLEGISLEIVDFYSNKGYDQNFIDEALEYSANCESIRYDNHSQLLEIKNTSNESVDQRQVFKPKFEPLQYPRFDGTV